jgi:hypothetical protein
MDFAAPENPAMESLPNLLASAPAIAMSRRYWLSPVTPILVTIDAPAIAPEDIYYLFPARALRWNSPLADSNLVTTSRP